MKRSILYCIAAVVAVLASSFILAEGEVEMIVLVDRTESVSNQQLSQLRAEIIEEAATQAAPQMTRFAEELSENGFVLASEEAIDQGKMWWRIATRTDVDAIRDLGFVPIHLSGSEFDRAELLGVGGTHSKDGLVHNLIYRFSHPSLGLVVLEEHSFATDPDTVRLTVSKPLGNIWINGMPGTAFSLSTPDGTIGRTTVKYFTESKKYSLHVYRTIPIGSEAFGDVERLAQALH